MNKMDENMLISLKSIKKIYRTEDVETHALSGIDISIDRGEYVSITGPSGCGKSTLLSIIGMLDVATEGEYFLRDINVCDLNRSERAGVRNQHIGFIFQSFNLIGDLTVAENIELPLSYRSDINKRDRESMVGKVMEQLGICHRAKHFPSQLSGGQQQRAAIARAIVGEPSLILADEPTGNLDSKNAESVLDILDGLHKSGSTICMVTHDPRSSERTHRNIELCDGMVV